MAKDVKKFLLNICLFTGIIVIILVTFFIAITQLITEKYRTSYQYVVNLKYEHLKETNGPKVIIVGGSSCAFGIDEDAISKKVGMPVVNLGLHAGMGMMLNTELAKVNIQEGDIIVLAHEYAQLSDLTSFDPEIIVSGIDNHIELYQYVPISYTKKLVQYIPTYILKKINSIEEKRAVDVYSVGAFDEKGCMVYTRSKCTLPEEITSNYGKVELREMPITRRTQKYINQFCQYAEEKGAKVVITFAPIIDERFYGTTEEITEYEKQIDSTLNCIRISNVKDYIFPREYMYDTIHHCNDLGERIRSERLAEDIIQYMEQMRLK